jgi:Fe-Mn family superoxide dismutase
MQLHHTKHHQAYVNGLNTAEDACAAADSTAEKIAVLGALKFNGGGHINHSLFWKNLAPTKAQGGKIVTGGQLEKAIGRDFGSVEEFKKAMNAKTGAIQGSGWGWLVRTDSAVPFAPVHSFCRAIIKKASNSKF